MKSWSQTAVVVCLASTLVSAIGSSECLAKAWVRAEDLSPGATSHGDLRIKVIPAHCGTQIAAVSLRLQLDQFSEVKYLRRGSILPKVRKADNQTRPESFNAWDFGQKTNEVVYNYTEYDNAMTDAAYWVVKAEERRGWVTETTLFADDLDFSQPRVTPFVVVSPAVNYPPAFKRSRGGSNRPKRWHSATDIGYHYIATVTFQDGHTVELPAGHTNFRPTFALPHASPQPFIWNTSLEERSHQVKDSLPDADKYQDKVDKCLPPVSRASFAAEVIIEEGSVFRVGQQLKGKIIINATTGSTTMSSISVNLNSDLKHQWAIDQADNGGDFNFTQSPGHANNVISGAEQSSIFQEAEDSYKTMLYRLRPTSSGLVNGNNNVFDFAIDVPEDFFPQFSSHYWSSSANLEIQLTVDYSNKVARCIHGDSILESSFVDFDEDPKSDDEWARIEDGLWDSHTRVGKARRRPGAVGGSLWLHAKVPLVIVGQVSAKPAEHYLSPGVQSPAILPSSALAVFPLPLAHPVIVEEPLANTTARILRPGRSFDPHAHRIDSFEYHNWWRQGFKLSDPSLRYNGGDYVGVLWKKKVVARERGLFPVETAGEGSQQHFSVAN
ncbi:hypothetical protein C8F01DRAFT_1115903 [Mycena amicta]|nr:hypothetical protein C8F01DRAFT_1115903 [Mycena amicta]